MSLTFAIALQRSARLSATWTTVHLAWAALAQGHRLWFFSPEDAEISRRGILRMRVGELDAPVQDREVLTSRLMAGELRARHVDLLRADLMLLRLNPLSPTAMVVALMAREAGMPVVNDPVGLGLTRSKAWLATLPDVPHPLTFVSRAEGAAALFQVELDRDVVVKPSMGSGGRGVALVRRRDRAGLITAMRAAGEASEGPVIIQEYLPQAEEGEKRLVWIDGELVGAYLRRRAEGEFRHNLRLGGQPEPASIEASDLDLARCLRPHLERNGIRIAGLDVIGGLVVEVNCLNPGGVHYSSQLQAEPATLRQSQESVADRMVRLLAATPRKTHVPTTAP